MRKRRGCKQALEVWMSFAALGFALPGHLTAQAGPGIITTIAGRGPVAVDRESFSGDDGPATQARLSFPSSMAPDEKGNIYIADRANHRIRRVGPDGVITTVAGTGVAGFSGDGGSAAQAQLSAPSGVAVDARGSLYIADFNNHRVRRVGPDGVITTVAGGGSFLGDSGPATQAQLSAPSGVAVDARGSLYIADFNNHRVRRVGPDGVITTVAGGGSFLGDSGPATLASLGNPRGVAVDTKGNLYIVEFGNHRIRLVEGLGATGSIGPPAGVSGPSISLSALLLTFEGTQVGATSRKTFTISNVGTESLSITGIAVGGTDATQFTASPTTATVAAGQSQIVTVTFAPRSVGLKSASLFIVYSTAGNPATIALSGMGVGTSAAQEGPEIITTVAGTGVAGFSGDGRPAALAALSGSIGVAVDIKGNVYIADT